MGVLIATQNIIVTYFPTVEIMAAIIGMPFRYNIKNIIFVILLLYIHVPGARIASFAPAFLTVVELLILHCRDE